MLLLLLLLLLLPLLCPRFCSRSSCLFMVRLGSSLILTGILKLKSSLNAQRILPP